jgi:hypothetical protein
MNTRPLNTLDAHSPASQKSNRVRFSEAETTAFPKNPEMRNQRKIRFSAFLPYFLQPFCMEENHPV